MYIHIAMYMYKASYKNEPQLHICTCKPHFKNATCTNSNIIISIMYLLSLLMLSLYLTS